MRYYMKKKNIITKIEKQKKAERYNIYIDDIYAFAVDADTLIKYQLLKEREIFPTELEQIIRSDGINKLYNQALRYISYKNRTVQEVTKYLEDKEYEPENIQQVITMLKESKYLNDKLYAENFIRDRNALNPKGKKLLEFELKQKGIALSIIDEKLSQIDSDTEVDLAYKLITKRRRSIRSDDWNILYNRLAGYLQRRGFSYSTINEALNLLKTDILDNISKE